MKQENVRRHINQTLFALGGTIGLFTGMSILSVIEAVFWMFRLIGGTSLEEDETGNNEKGRERKRSGCGKSKMVSEHQIAIEMKISG